ncbi:Acg family FMN-binding oxidoreductase [Actinocorallia populi]|uniref:Acg family FMN-binding oxidoreductase n=1 Tax=Actinocorallia populi TaxID=2079200 RepID=UPI000D08E4E6|nr:nitroreductase family protein [Actinocorallia populi]
MEPMSREEVLACVEAAVRAPSIHNTQPWLFLPEGDRIEVHADPSRRLPSVDPQGRALHLSLGAAVLNLCLAVAATGRRPFLALLPAPGDGRHVATVTADGPYTMDERALYEAIPVRRTSRRPFRDTPVPPDALRRLEEAALLQGGELKFTRAPERELLLGLVRTADERKRNDVAYRAELRTWTTDDPYREDGIPLAAMGPWSRDDTVPVRDFAPDLERPVPSVREFESEPVIAVLAAIGRDTPADWLRAGQALQRVLLEATRLGLATGLFTQPLEHPDLRALLADPARRTHVQAILRFGHAAEETPPTARRPAEDVVARTRPLPLRPTRPG